MWHWHFREQCVDWTDIALKWTVTGEAGSWFLRVLFTNPHFKSTFLFFNEFCWSLLLASTTQTISRELNLKALKRLDMQAVSLFSQSFCMVKQTAGSVRVSEQAGERPLTKWHLGIWESVDVVWKCCERDRSQCADSITTEIHLWPHSVSSAKRASALTGRLLFRPCTLYPDTVSRLRLDPVNAEHSSHPPSECFSKTSQVTTGDQVIFLLISVV